MPIAVKDYTWDETDKTIFITVPLKGVSANKVDIFSTENYVKVNYPPYLFEGFLHAAVHDKTSAAQIGNGVVVFKLEKQEPQIWGQLQNPNAEDRRWQIEQRQLAITRSQERAAQEKEARDEVKRETDRYAVRQQMKLEGDDKGRIESAKQSARDEATEELEKWKEHQEQLARQEKEKQEAKAKQEKEAAEEAAKSKKRAKNKNIFHEEAGGAPMRQSGVIQVNFTPRVFPTPSRESTADDENTWLRKQAESRRVIELENEDLTEEEKNPMWLLDKGNKFMKAGDYQAAVNVYSHAIRLSCNMPELFSSRAACHLKLRNLFKCLEDSSKALELLTPPVPQNAANRCEAHTTRGAAFCGLELHVEALQEYEAAIKLDPENKDLQAEADKLRHTIQTVPAES